MKKDIRNTDKQGKRHGVQIDYHPNGNIGGIYNYHHGKANGYRGYYKPDKSINYKQYCNMGKWIYNEDHWIDKQIKIRI